jgi:hypothetical protein
LIYRSMTREGDRPRIGPTARSLGARVPGDIAARDGRVWPGTGGMSVAPAWRDLPPWRIPRRLIHLAPDAAGNHEDACWRMGEGPFEIGRVAEGLALRPDRPGHGTVEPSEATTVDRYQADLATTRDLWHIDED